MNWSWTQSFETISTWRKVASFNWSNAVYCTRFAEWIWKTAFTMHFRMKNKVNYANTIWWWRDRNNSWPSTTDKWWLWFFADNSTKQYPSWWAIDWQSASIWINTYTSAFYLYTATINWRTVNIYKNGNLVWTRTWSYNIIWWSNTWWKFFYWWHIWYSETSLSSWSWSQLYIWEIVVEDKVETVAEIQYFYNKTKNHYA